MKKTAVFWLATILCACALLLVACNDTGSGNTDIPGGSNGETSDTNIGDDGKESSGVGSEGHDHVFGEWVTVKEPTKSEQGEQQRTCACGEVELQYTPAKGSEGLILELNSDRTSYSVTGIGECTDTDIYIPTYYEGYPVTSVYGFAESEITSIIIPEGVIEIGTEAFYKCGGLVNVSLPDSVEFIGKSAFEYCTNIKSIKIPQNIKEIEAWAFAFCNRLTDVTVPSKAFLIDNDTFYESEYVEYNEYDNAYYLGNSNNPYVLLYKAKDTSITSCNAHSDTKIIGNAFVDCDNFETITVPDTIEFVGAMLQNCENLQYNEYDNAFYIGNKQNPYVVLVKAKDNSIVSCNIHQNTKMIAAGAFQDCKELSNISISDGVEKIDGNAFKNCISLTSVIIPDNVKSIGERTFYGCTGITNIVLPNGIAKLENGLLYECSGLTDISIPQSVTSIGDSVFANCSGLTNFTIPDTITSIGSGVFAGCSSITSIEWPKAIKIIDDGMFSGCTGLTEIVIPDGVVMIGSGAFFGCTSLVNVTIPDSVKYIDWWAFGGCSSLYSVYIPAYCCTYAFAECSNLTHVTLAGNNGKWEEQVFGGCNRLIEVCNQADFVIESGLDSECERLGLNSVRNVYFYEKDSCLKAIGDYVFFDDGYVIYLVAYTGEDSEIVLPRYKEKRYEIFQYAFNNNATITSITIPDCVTKIGAYAFERCTNLRNVVLGEGVRVIDECAFFDCSTLESVHLGAKVAVIDTDAFSKCYAISNIYYTGTENEWNLIDFGRFNAIYDNDATIHYNWPAPEQ
ncbi:MAG: leucine-rich repeat domain-containing protein [Ruminococcaceae bacterium]|nr:leucine-rich repeat domain-containing protein [Oscillospiraceae bacterium]